MRFLLCWTSSNNTHTYFATKVYLAKKTIKSPFNSNRMELHKPLTTRNVYKRIQRFHVKFLGLFINSAHLLSAVVLFIEHYRFEQAAVMIFSNENMKFLQRNYVIFYLKIKLWYIVNCRVSWGSTHDFVHPQRRPWTNL